MAYGIPERGQVIVSVKNHQPPTNKPTNQLQQASSLFSFLISVLCPSDRLRIATMIMRIFLLLLLCAIRVQSLATPLLFDRFRPSCPADPNAIRRFDPALVNNENDSSVWVAVYRSNNNKPSVLVRDEFLQAMRSATDAGTELNISDAQPAGLETSVVREQAPVAVARLCPSEDSDTWILDSMRCILKKEDTDEECDGGSEHKEALSTAIDCLLEHYLKSNSRFEGAIRTKATLVSGVLLEERGFREVTKLEKDMASHVSSFDDCTERYAARSVSTISKSPGAQRRALTIVSLLGRMDRDQDIQAAANALQSGSEAEDDYDPWANIKRYL
jgi:hypothetical protein